MTHGEDVLPTGFASLDGLVEGLRPGELAVLSGNMNVEFAFNLIDRIGIRSGRTVLLCTGGTPREQIIDRLTCCHAGIDSATLNGEELGEDKWNTIRDAARDVYDSGVLIDDSDVREWETFEMRAREMHPDYGLELLVANCSSIGGGALDENRQTDRLTKLKGLAASLDIPVVAQGLGVALAAAEGTADLMLHLDCAETGQDRADQRPVQVSVTRRGEFVGELTLSFWNKQLRFGEEQQGNGCAHARN
ncbi:MAG: DnaB-like helicase C-terminal domain-containing protein [bacterium]